MSQAQARQQKYYFSDRLKGQLARISRYPLTVVEAPSGFGKTTAVREYLRAERPEAAAAWYTCLGEPATIAWSWISELFAGISRKTADDLKNLKLPSAETLHYITSALRAMSCEKETYLIVDNFQRVHFDIGRELVEALSMHENPLLHIVIITLPSEPMRKLPLHSDSIYLLDALSFFFDREGIAGLARMEGFRLTPEEQEDLYARTEGWVSAIRLQLLHYGETGAFAGSAGIEQLVETAIWDRLQPFEQDFLLSVSVFDCFTARQAAHMLDNELFPGEIEERLRAIDFIRFLPDTRMFTIHSILHDYLRNRFNFHRPPEYQEKTLRSAARACAAMGQFRSAAQFYHRTGDFEALLSLPFTRAYMESQKEHFSEGLFMDIVRDCPDEIMRAHPSAMTVFAHFALLNGRFEVYQSLCALLRMMVKWQSALTDGQMRRLGGELILLETLGFFNDLSRMRAGFEAAGKLLAGAPEAEENSALWFSVFPTAFGLLWREGGALDKTLETVEEIKPFYRELSLGQDAGLSSLIRAEAMLMRGRDSDAEVLCHRAAYEAQANRQPGILIYTKLCLARVFILRGDAESFLSVFKRLLAYAEHNDDFSIQRMAELCLSVISLCLGVKDYAASWLYDTESVKKSLYPFMLPFAEALRFRLLLLDRRYSELYAHAQLALDEGDRVCAGVKYRLPQLCYHALLAAARHNNGEIAEAQSHMKAALDLALPDGVFLPFAEFDCMPELLAGADIPRAAARAKLLSLCKRHAAGASAIAKALLQDKSPLTPREREVALLARERLSAKEIAEKLFIAEPTVKSTLARVYSKLEIHSKNELASAEF